jgi:hypothetical protein
MTTMTASHLALLVAVAVIVLVLMLVVVAVAVAVPIAVAVGSVALAFGVGYHYLVTAPQVRWRARTRRPLRQWAATPAAPRELDGPQWTQAFPTGPPPNQVPAVREQVAGVLAEWEVRDEAAEPVLLVVTELLTNALEHAAAPIRITLALGEAFVRVQVHDGAGEPPSPRTDGPAHVRGRGLEIVETLALRHGWTPEPHGKTVWADVPTHWPT